MKNMDELITLFADAALEIGQHRFEGLKSTTQIAELGIDSVELLEIFGYVEEELDIELSDEDLQGITSLQDLGDLITGQL